MIMTDELYEVSKVENQYGTGSETHVWRQMITEFDSKHQLQLPTSNPHPMLPKWKHYLPCYYVG